MSQPPEDPPADVPPEPASEPAETAMQRALRLKKDAQAGRSGAPGAGRFNPRASRAMPAGASRPWMKK